MIVGTHVVLYSADAVADRRFFDEVLDFPSVDAGAGWLIFALPPAELAVHPAEGSGQSELFLMCDDLNHRIDDLRGRGVVCSDVERARWGSMTHISLPGGGTVGLYQPTHPTALGGASS